MAALPSDVLPRVDAAILALAETPRPTGTKKLRGGSGLYRIRVGDYRIVYDVNDRERVVSIATVGHRSDVYRRR
jgi:mRNA interferase RelE/StbE